MNLVFGITKIQKRLWIQRLSTLKCGLAFENIEVGCDTVQRQSTRHCLNHFSWETGDVRMVRNIN